MSVTGKNLMIVTNGMSDGTYVADEAGNRIAYVESVDLRFSGAGEPRAVITMSYIEVVTTSPDAQCGGCKHLLMSLEPVQPRAHCVHPKWVDRFESDRRRQDAGGSMYNPNVPMWCPLPAAERPTPAEVLAFEDD